MWTSIRFRLTIWYVAVFGLLLSVFSAYIYSELSSDLRNEFDVSLLRTVQTTANTFIEFGERKQLEDGAQDTVSELRIPDVTAAIFRGQALMAAGNSEIVDSVSNTGLATHFGAGGKAVFATDKERGKRLASLSFLIEGQPYTVVLTESLDKLLAQLTEIRRIIMFGLPAAVLLSALGGFFLAGKSLGPVVTISRQAERISATNLDERLTIPNPRDELGQLARVFNELLARLDKSFRVMREFIADASHELRTPIAIVRAEAEVSLERERSERDYRQSLGIISEQSKRMTRIVTDMFSLAQADAGQQYLQICELYLNDLIEECCTAAQTLANSKNIRVTLDAEEDVAFRGDEELLKRMIMNLISNAVQYTAEGGSVSVILRTNTSGVRLIVSDTGIGIPPEHLGRVFDRFYRVDSSRSRAAGGSGLGLAIVKLASEAHKGRVEVSSDPGAGSTFTVYLPR